MAVNVVLKSVWDDKGIKSAQKEFADFGKGLGTAFAAVGAATAVAAGALVKFGADSIAAAENVAVANNRLSQVAKSMGIFGSETQAVTDRLIKFAEANELTVAVDAEVIKATQAKLLTFKNLAATADEVGGAMDRATMAALDLAAAGFGSAETNAVQLGKALQDPIKGITALARAGVTFTAQEKENIKVLVQSGKTLEAQNLILTAIETQVGGTAEATAKASDKMKLAFDNISEAVGAALLPVFNEFANEIIKVTPELEQALAPAAAEIAKIFRDEVLPAVQNFTKWLASPQGTKTLKDLTQAVIDAIKGFIDFIGWVVQNREALGTLLAVMATLVITYKTVTGAAALYQAGLVLLNRQVVTATATTTAFSTAMKLLPWAALITGATLFVSSMSQYADEVYGSKINTEGLTEAQIKEARQLENLRRQLAQYEYALANATEGNKKLAKEGIAKTRAEIGILEVKTKGAIGELNRFNNIKLDNLRKELRDTSGELNRFNNLRNGFVAAYNPELVITDSATGTGAGIEKAFSKVQKFIKDAQKDLASAQVKYNETIQKAQKSYADNILKTEADFAKKLSGIIQQSQNRLRDAYKQSAQMSINDFLQTFNQAEDKRLAAFYKAQEEAKEANKAFTDVFVGADPVQAFVKSLRDRLQYNRMNLALSAKLFEAGFSQVFIEQILASGKEGGDAFAQGLLDASPETIREIQSLFSQINDQAETGMDALAREIFDKAGFATRELRELYADTQGELAEALLKLKEDFDQEVLDANNTLIDSVKAIREAFKENIDSMKGDLGGLGKIVDEFMKKLGKVEADAAKALVPTIPGAAGGATGGAIGGGLQGVNVLASSVTNATGILIDSINDLEDVRRYFEERIVAASEFAAQSINRGNLAAAASAQATRDELFAQLRAFRAQGTAAVGTVINVNVKTDSTQSLAMVGKSLGNTITKYVQSGGQVVVSPVG